jgi:uncharacterized protein
MGYFERGIHQIAALPLFVNANGSVDLCLVTARGSGRWIIPKGNPILGLAPHEVAEQEALEEAGLVGEAHPDCIGSFRFDRRQTSCAVDVYVLKVERQLPAWPEMAERTILRCNAPTALQKICSQGLADLIGQYLHASQPSRQEELLEQHLGFA